MINNQTSQPQHNKQQSKAITCNHRHDAEAISYRIISEIVNEAQLILKRNAFLAKNMKNYSSLKTVNKFNQINNLLDIQAFNGFKEEQQPEPTPLYVDSLLPVSADIDPENEYKLSLVKLNTLEDSNMKVRNKGKQSKLDLQQNLYVKLDLNEGEQQDGFTKQLRNQQEQKHAKMQGQKRAKAKIEKARQEKEKGKKKQQKISYDYNGQVIDIRTVNTANLVSSIVNGNTNTKLNIVKQAINDPSPTTLEGQNSAKGKSKKLIEMQAAMAAKKKEQVEFSQVKSLAENYRNTTYGVKYTYQGKTIEEKKKSINVKELKKTLSQRKLSKDEFRIIQKLNNNNHQEFQNNLRKSAIKTTQQNPKRTYSEAKINQSRMRKTTQTIHVASDNLKHKLLEKVRLEEPIHKKTESEIRQDTELKLDSIDRFNLKYMTTGGSIQSNTTRQFYSKGSKNQLPKIAHTTLYSHTKPKGREKLKDANEIMREMRKRFEDKLRV